MNIPESVKIGWRNYAIELGEHRTGDNGGNLYGEILYEERKIFLYDKMDEDEANVTLLHEIAHGILYNIGSKLRTDENFITALSENLYQVIKDNPGLFKDI